MARGRRPATPTECESPPGRAAPRTRDRILAESLALFNTRGLGRVTTAEIAAAAGSAKATCSTIFRARAAWWKLCSRLSRPRPIAVAGRLPADPAALLAYQRAWFDLIWRYRCVYRDGIAMVEIAPALRPRIHVLRAETQALARGVFEAAVRAGRLRIAPEALGRLIDNAWIVSSHWMSHRLQGGTALTEADRDWGFAQVRDLFAPYLVARD